MILVIDTATERGVVALVEEGKVLRQKALSSANHLVPTLQELKVNLKELDFIVVGVGPGSYTGIRVGVAVAKSLSYACQIPLVGVSTLHGFIPSKDTKFTAMIDARISGSYVLEGEKRDGEIHYISEPKVCPLDQLQSIDTLVTPHRVSLERKIKTSVSQWEDVESDPLQLAKIGLEKFRKGAFSTDGSVEILYLRKTQAELERV